MNRPLPPLRELRRRHLADLERDYLGRVLRAARGRVGEAARIAGISERALFSKMRAYGLRKEEFRVG